MNEDIEAKKDLRKLIEAFRSTGDLSLLEPFKLDIKPTEDGWHYDLNAWPRTQLILELFENSQSEDKPLIKWLLTEEINGQEYELQYYSLDVNAYLLYKYMENSDVYQLFESKFAYGNVFHLDVELIFGYDKEEMKQFLSDPNNKHEFNRKILSTIKDYERNPDAKFKTREEYINYYENRKIVHIKNDISASENNMKTGKY